MHALNWWGVGAAYHENPAIGWTLLTFVVFIGLIRYFSKEPLSVFLEKRRKKIKNSIEEAAQARLKAEEELRSYEKRLSELAGWIQKMKADFERQGESERARLHY